MVSIAEGRYNRYFAAAGLGLVLVIYLIWSQFRTPTPEPGKELCYQSPSIEPSSGPFANSSQFLSESYKKKSVKLLAGAIRVPSMSYDDMAIDPTQDERFDVFNELHEYLFESFPLAAKYVETVNAYGLLYTIEGTDPSLKPLVYMAHQDVVPVNEGTLDQWTYPPFEAHFDGEMLWGRGTCDTKNSLVAQLEAVESLLSQGWAPKRTVVLSFGFDEEISGVRGAKHLAKTLLNRYGENGVEMIIDEGVGAINVGKTLFAAPAVAEKGRVDYKIVINTPGGHSSNPPDHTGIGIAAELIQLIENNPFTPAIETGGVLEQFFNCVGERAKGLPSIVRKKFINAGSHDKLFPLLEKDPNSRYFVRTSQAFDIIHGGVKINALPEQVEIQLDHRIAIHQTIPDINERLSGYIKEIARKYNLGFEFEGKVIRKPTEFGGFHVTTLNSLEPAPLTPFKGEVWDLLVGTTRHVYDEVVDHPYGPIIVAPTLMPANTDTAHYWHLSKNIFRYQPLIMDDAVNIHTVDEHLNMRSHYLGVVWYYEFLLNATS